MRIVIVCDHETPHLVRFLESFLEAGHVVGLVVLSPGANKPLPREVKVLWRSFEFLTMPQDIRRYAKRMAELVKPFMADVMFGFPLNTGAYAATLMRSCPVVSVCMAYDVLFKAVEDFSHMDAVKYSLSHSEQVVVDSQFLVDKVLSLGAKSRGHIQCVPYGISLDRFRATPHVMADAVKLRAKLGLDVGMDHDILVIANRRHDPLYYPQTTIKGFAAALEKCPNLFLYMAGAGSMFEELKELVASLGITDRVVFAGWLDRTNLAVSLAAADIYVSSSSVDGSSVSMLQAMASGLPIIASDILGNREWVNVSQCGLLTPVGDETALADALLSLAVMGREQRACLGKNGQALVVRKADWKANSQIVLQQVATAAAAKPWSSA